MDKTPDVAQLSTCCGKPLVWDYRRCEEPGYTYAEAWWDGTCPMCGCLNVDAMMSPERNLMPTEQMLLARIAELEEAQRWRVTVREMPPVWVAVLGWWEVADWPFGVTRWDGSQWWAEEEEENRSVRGPDRWQPLPGVPDAK